MRKNFILFAAWAFIAVMFTGCSKISQARLYQAIEEANKECPIETGIGTFDRIDYDGDIISFVYTIDNDLISVDKLKVKRNEAKQVFSNNLSKGTVRALLQEIVKAKAALRLDITDARSAAHMDIDFTPEELQGILQRPAGNDYELTLQSETMLTNLMTPTEIDFVTVLDSVSLSKTEFTYHYTYDDEQLTADKITATTVGQLKEEHLAGFIQMMRTPAGESLMNCLKACCETDRKLHHIYKGANGGKPFDYSFSPQELDDAIRKSKAVIDPATLPALNR